MVIGTDGGPGKWTISCSSEPLKAIMDTWKRAITGKPLAKLAGLAVVVALAAVALAMPGSRGDRAPVMVGALSQPWPAFKMTYKSLGHHNGMGQPMTYDVWQFNYVDKNHWRNELVESTRVPGQVGMWMGVDGRTFTSYSPIIGNYFRSEIRPDLVAIPNDWLSPHRMNAIRYRGYQQVPSSAPDRLRFRKEETAVCKGGPPACPDRSRETYMSTSEMTFTKDHGIPVEVIERLDGELLGHITVLDLILR